MKQGELFKDVCEMSNNTLSSDVDSTVNTSTESIGQTHTKTCNVCSVDLTLGNNWTHGNQRKHVYFCRTCDATKRKYNLLKQKAREIGNSTLKAYDSVKEGEVYIIVHNAWPEWVKIGMAINSEDRLKGYQTGSPFRDYILMYSVYTKDRRKTEAQAHRSAEVIAERRGEWFKMSVGEAKECIQHGL